MSRENLGNKQTFILHNCIINDERYDLIINPPRQKLGYIRTKGQTIKKKVISKENEILENYFQNEETQSPNQKLMKYKIFPG